MLESEIDALKNDLWELRIEHSDLDKIIEELASQPHIDQMLIRRMKKRKLQLKDLIEKIESELIPDLNA
jgi:hypothetical protein